MRRRRSGNEDRATEAALAGRVVGSAVSTPSWQAGCGEGSRGLQGVHILQKEEAGQLAPQRDPASPALQRIPPEEPGLCRGHGRQGVVVIPAQR